MKPSPAPFVAALELTLRCPCRCQTCGSHAGAPRADDILFGVHGGVGLEVAVHERVSLFLDAQAIGYLAHDRTGQGWTGSVGGNEHPIAVLQPTMGLQVHLGK